MRKAMACSTAGTTWFRRRFVGRSQIDLVNSIFQREWWLEAVAPGAWDVVEVSRDGSVVARLPIVLSRKLGLQRIVMPPLTQTLGPCLLQRKSSYAKQIGEQKELMTQLIEQLPPHDYFSQTLHWSMTNWLPFYWKGFRQTTFYTYLLDDLTDLDALWSGIRPNVRGDVKKAENRFNLLIRTEPDLSRFIAVNELTFRRQGKVLRHSRAFIERLDSACAAHGARRMFFAEAPDGRVHAALYLVWDDQSAYYLMGGADPELRHSGATSLLVWRAIQFAATVTKRFDFEGSMIEPIERFFRAFGAKQVPYSQVTWSSRRMTIIHNARAVMRGLRGKRA